ncbi:MAG: DUF2167 domain-containing protein [Salibacteraceae bacterium]|nr:DUF2167 domain-containing protein [Salibacteraceae bacterium]
MKNLLLVGAICLPLFSISQDFENTDADSLVYDQFYSDSIYASFEDSVNNALQYEHGTIDLGDGIATLQVPAGFKYLNPDQSLYVLSTLWGNPPSPTLGMLFPEDMTPLSDQMTFAIELTYAEEGYVEDDDAEDIDYDDLLEQMQTEIHDANPQRQEMGYSSLELVGWAAEPFYDSDTKKLHWAKELQFEGTEENTLNYDVRVLGRKGYLSLNAISDISQLNTVQANMPQLISSVNFNDGFAYGDFNPDIDEIAAYGIGGLIAGKVLMKAGFIGLILKFWKIIALAVAGGLGLFKNKLAGLFSKRNSED